MNQPCCVGATCSTGFMCDANNDVCR
jgi:hypothetical protein